MVGNREETVTYILWNYRYFCTKVLQTDLGDVDTVTRLKKNTGKF